jgi:large subunit ribosomal protein L28
MGKICIVTGKKTVMGMNVSHSNRKTKKILRPNVQKRRLLNPATGRLVTVCISARGMKTLKKWGREGKKYDLAKLSAGVLL